VELPIVEEPAEEPKPVLEESWDLDAVLGEETPLIEPEPEKAVSAPPEEKSKIKKPMRIIRREQKEEEEEEERIEAEALESLEAELISDKNVQIDPGSRSGLKELIDEKTEKVFVKKLFGGDSESYGKLMLKLEDAESWRVAKILIDNELFKRDVDPFSREAIKLVDLVYSRYYPEEGIGGKR
jgi:hypothetical protein